MVVPHFSVIDNVCLLTRNFVLLISESGHSIVKCVANEELNLINIGNNTQVSDNVIYKSFW